MSLRADIGRVDEIAKLFDATFSNFGRLDVLVNNASLPLYKSLVEITEAEYDRIFAVNVKGTFFACQQAARRMADGGRIINFSSSTTVMMLATYSAYVATKGAVEKITRSLGKELGPRKITVNTISPGATDTELFGLNKTAEDKKRFAQMAALGRNRRTARHRRRRVAVGQRRCPLDYRPKFAGERRCDLKFGPNSPAHWQTSLMIFGNRKR